jgi:glutamyl-tRNA synthetase
MTVRTRFSPSPTGMIHLGNARAALFSALFAAKQRGVFILRIEDTDAARSEERYVESLQNDLHWFGLSWQEGPGKHGEYGPYWQSQRQPIYAEYYKILEEKQLIYPCFCTDQELILARKIQLSRGQAPRYGGTCRHLSREAIDRRVAAGAKFAWRYAVPPNMLVHFVDLIKGPQQFNSDDIGDFIIRRTDGTAPFLFCNAIDDAMMKITHVLRGEDHLTNTPKQIMILNTLSLPVPHYGHLSLIVGEDGAPLSKRHGSFSLHDIRASGYLPMAIMNYLARLGHAYETQLLCDFHQLAAYFELNKLSRSPVHFDVQQLLYWQKIAVQNLSEEQLLTWLGEDTVNQVPLEKRSLFVNALQCNIIFPCDALEWAKILFHDNIHIEHQDIELLQSVGEQFFVEAEQAVDKHGLNLPAILDEMKQTLGLSRKKLFMPLRIALTGKIHGPELVHIAELLGQHKVKQRLGKAFKLSTDLNK